MALFDLKELDAAQDEQPRARGAAVWLPDSEDVLELDGLADLSALMVGMAHGRSLHYVSRGLWSVHDMLFAILDHVGPADVWMATWTITQDPIQKVLAAMEAGKIRTIWGLFDTRVQIRSEAVWHYARLNMARIALTANHAKVTVVENEDWAVVINGSQNYTRNPRIEAGVLTVSRKVAAFHRKWIEDKILECEQKP